MKAPTTNDIIAAIDAALVPEPMDPGVTAYEYQKAHPELTIACVRNRLMRAVRDGRMLAGRAYRTSNDGRKVTQTVYRPSKG